MDKKTIGSPTHMKNAPAITLDVQKLNNPSSLNTRGLTATGYIGMTPKVNKVISIEGTEDFRLSSKGNTALGVFTPS